MDDIDIDCYEIRYKLDAVDLTLRSQHKERKEGNKEIYICKAKEYIDRARLNVEKAHWCIRRSLELEEKGDKKDEKDERH